MAKEAQYHGTQIVIIHHLQSLQKQEQPCYARCGKLVHVPTARIPWSAFKAERRLFSDDHKHPDPGTRPICAQLCINSPSYNLFLIYRPRTAHFLNFKRDISRALFHTELRYPDASLLPHVALDPPSEASSLWACCNKIYKSRPLPSSDLLFPHLPKPPTCNILRCVSQLPPLLSALSSRRSPPRTSASSP